MFYPNVQSIHPVATMMCLNAPLEYKWSTRRMLGLHNSNIPIWMDSEQLGGERERDRSPHLSAKGTNREIQPTNVPASEPLPIFIILLS